MQMLTDKQAEAVKVTTATVIYLTIESERNRTKTSPELTTEP